MTVFCFLYQKKCVSQLSGKKKKMLLKKKKNQWLLILLPSKWHKNNTRRYTSASQSCVVPWLRNKIESITYFCFHFRVKLTAGPPDYILQESVLRSHQPSLAPMHYGGFRSETRCCSVVVLVLTDPSPLSARREPGPPESRSPRWSSVYPDWGFKNKSLFVIIWSWARFGAGWVHKVNCN